MPGGNLEAESGAPRIGGPAALADRLAALSASVTGDDGADSDGPPASPVMPAVPFPTFYNTPTLPQQSPGNGYESGRDSRAR